MRQGCLIPLCEYRTHVSSATTKYPNHYPPGDIRNLDEEGHSPITGPPKNAGQNGEAMSSLSKRLKHSQFWMCVDSETGK